MTAISLEKAGKARNKPKIKGLCRKASLVLLLFEPSPEPQGRQENHNPTDRPNTNNPSVNRERVKLTIALRSRRNDQGPNNTE
jgi:hypothetical protein